MTEKTVATRTVFDGRLLKVDVAEIELDTGERSTREIVRHPGATAVLARRDDGRFLLVRQHRTPVGRTMLEIVAGVLRPGENPDDCAVRELKEETGYQAREITKLGIILPSPGYTQEELHLYYARLAPEQGRLELDEDERIELVDCSAEDIEGWISDGTVQDGKTLAAWLLYRMKSEQGLLR